METANGELACQSWILWTNFSVNLWKTPFRICPDDYNEFLDESSIPIEFEEEIITMTEQLPEPPTRRPVKASAPPPPPKSHNAHRPMNFAHAMKLFKNMQKKKAQISAREKHKVKKVKEKPPQKQPALQQVAGKKQQRDDRPKSSTSSKAISKSARKKKHKSKKGKSVNSSKLASVPKVDEDEIEIDIVDVWMVVARVQQPPRVISW